jgi:hypothetical protein
MIQLAKQAEQLKSKGISVITVQASIMEQNQLTEWLKKYNIPFQVGMVRSDDKKICFAWGVKSLPWMILTDRQHVVQAEGFGVEEIVDRIKNIKQ